MYPMPREKQHSTSWSRSALASWKKRDRRSRRYLRPVPLGRRNPVSPFLSDFPLNKDIFYYWYWCLFLFLLSVCRISWAIKFWAFVNIFNWFYLYYFFMSRFRVIFFIYFFNVFYIPIFIYIISGFSSIFQFCHLLQLFYLNKYTNLV